MASVSKAPEVIYHYTSAKVLLSIFEHKQLWASDVLYMNDDQEVLFAKGQALKKIEDKIDKLSKRKDPSLKSQIETLSATLHELEGMNAEKYTYPRVYATCFCEKGDLLSQWRAYGSDDGGYAVGFRSEVLRTIKNPVDISTHPALEKVHYGPKSASGVMQAMADSLAQNPTLHPGPKGAQEFRDEVLRRLAVVKNPAFKEENEWRLLAGGESPMGFRTSALGLVPYIKFDLPRNAIAEVRIGPGPNRYLKLNALRQLIVKYSPSKNMSIGFSDAPLRKVN